MLSVRLQGKFYLVIEELSQLFRSLVPIQLWYKYIMGDDSSNSYFLGGVLIVLYSLCKVRRPRGLEGRPEESPCIRWAWGIGGAGQVGSSASFFFFMFLAEVKFTQHKIKH